MTRRDLLRLALAQASLAYLSKGCQKVDEPNPPKPTSEVYELTDGKTLYDDFDGNGCLQTYDNQSQAEAGKLSSKLWQPSRGVELVQNPAVAGLGTLVDEENGRLLWVGAKGGVYQTPNGPFVVEMGKVYGSAQAEFAAESGWILRMANSVPGLILCLLVHPRDIDFVDYKTLSADVMLSAVSTARDFYGALSYHTTIPEQPPGKSWFTDLGIRRYPNGLVSLFAQAWNNNTFYRFYEDLEEAQPDRWYNLRLAVVTREEDLSLKADELRLEYYIDGVLKATEIPEDSALLLDPERTGYGPNRSLIVFNEQAEGDGLAFFDNVRAVYRNRVRL
jgi:hypothetical protein